MLYKLRLALAKTFTPSSVLRCTVCERDALKFFDFGQVNVRIEAKCPWCGSLERHRLMWETLRRRTVLGAGRGDERAPSSLDLLHIAPESFTVPLLRELVGTGYRSGDLEPGRADLVVDVTEIDSKDGSFDMIICSHVLEHVPDDAKALREFYRVLRPGGVALLPVPITAGTTFEDPTVTDPAEKLRLFGQEDHVRACGPDYFDRMEAAGFEVERIVPTSLMSEADAQRCRFLEGDILPLCRKPAAG